MLPSQIPVSAGDAHVGISDTRVDKTEYRSCLALRHTRGIGPRTWKALLDCYGSARVAANQVGNWIQDGVATRAQVRAFEEKGWKKKAEQEEADCVRAGMRCLMYSEQSYPQRLQEIPDPPILLYALGNISVLSRPCLAVVGSRKCTPYARRMANKLCAGLVRAGFTLVSGFAQGIDRIAHEHGCSDGGSTIAVLGTGLDIVYPASNRDIWEPVASSGLIISEFAPGTLPKAKNFPYRNRIISGLSLGTLVIQAANKSGSLITARLALEQNREVFAVPGPVGREYEGCHALIQSGAKLVQGVDDILEELEFFINAQQEPELPSEKAVSPAPSLDADQQQLLCCLKEHEALHIDTLTQLMGWESNKVSQTLVMLEILQQVEQHAGMMYSAVQ